MAWTSIAWSASNLATTRANGEQARSLWRQVEARGVDAPDDDREALQRWICQVVAPGVTIQGAKLADMGEWFCPGMLVRYRTGSGCDLENLLGCDVENSASASTKRADQPGQAIRSIRVSRATHFICVVLLRVSPHTYVRTSLPDSVLLPEFTYTCRPLPTPRPRPVSVGPSAMAARRSTVTGEAVPINV